MKGLPNEVKNDGNTHELIKVTITVLTLIVAIAAFEGRDLVSDRIIGGDIIPISPSGYGIIQEITYSAIKSDIIIMPIGWHNTWRNKKEIVRQPYLILKDKSNVSHRFNLAGEYSDISSTALGYGWKIKRTYVINPAEYSEYVSVFQIYPQNHIKFTFNSGDIYKVSIGYQRWHNGAFMQESEKPLFTMKIPQQINNNTEWEVDKYRWIYFDV